MYPLHKHGKRAMKIVTKLLLRYLIPIFIGCHNEIAEGVKKSDLSKDVEFVTDFGSIVLRLSNGTPKHGNNFIKLVNQKFYDGIASLTFANPNALRLILYL